MTKCDEFQTYKLKATKEIATLKNNIHELEKVIEHLNGELTTMHKQYEEVDSDYKREKKLRRKFREIVTELGLSLARSDTNTHYLLQFQVLCLLHQKV